MQDCKPVVCPEEQIKLSMQQSPQNRSEETEMKDVPYAQLVGCIQYLVVCTRPDLAHAASQISRFMQNPGKEHWKAAKRVLRYLKGTMKHRLCFPQSKGKAMLVGFSDADHAGCPDTRRSHSGYIVKVNGTAVAWVSKRQKCVTLSSCESEYIAVCECAKQIVWMRRLLKELGKEQKGTTSIFCDNQAAKALTENPIHHDRTKHIDMKYHYTRDLVEGGFIVVKHVPASDEEADILTKEYIGKNFRRLRDWVMGMKREMNGKEEMTDDDRIKRKKEDTNIFLSYTGTMPRGKGGGPGRNATGGAGGDATGGAGGGAGGDATGGADGDATGGTGGAARDNNATSWSDDDDTWPHDYPTVYPADDVLSEEMAELVKGVKGANETSLKYVETKLQEELERAKPDQQLVDHYLDQARDIKYNAPIAL